jgi:hypothetical protein
VPRRQVEIFILKVTVIVEVIVIEVFERIDRSCCRALAPVTLAFGAEVSIVGLPSTPGGRSRGGLFLLEHVASLFERQGISATSKKPRPISVACSMSSVSC